MRHTKSVGGQGHHDIEAKFSQGMGGIDASKYDVSLV
jgi:hypothetical protein